MCIAARVFTFHKYIPTNAAFLVVFFLPYFSCCLLLSENSNVCLAYTNKTGIRLYNNVLSGLFNLCAEHETHLIQTHTHIDGIVWFVLYLISVDGKKREKWIIFFKYIWKLWAENEMTYIENHLFQLLWLHFCLSLSKTCEENQFFSIVREHLIWLFYI